MEFNLEGYYIFDENIKDKFVEIINNNKKMFNDKNLYKLIVSFNFKTIEEDKLKKISNSIYDKMNDIRELTIDEAYRIMGFPDSFKKVTTIMRDIIK